MAGDRISLFSFLVFFFRLSSLFSAVISPPAWIKHSKYNRLQIKLQQKLKSRVTEWQCFIICKTIRPPKRFANFQAQNRRHHTSQAPPPFFLSFLLILTMIPYILPPMIISTPNILLRQITRLYDAIPTCVDAPPFRRGQSVCYLRHIHSHNNSERTKRHSIPPEAAPRPTLITAMILSAHPHWLAGQSVSSLVRSGSGGECGNPIQGACRWTDDAVHRLAVTW